MITDGAENSVEKKSTIHVTARNLARYKATIIMQD